MPSPKCPACSGPMRRSAIHEGGSLLTAFGAAGIGLILCLAIPGPGYLIGIPCILVGLFSRGRRCPVWLCRSCAHHIVRAPSFRDTARSALTVAAVVIVTVAVLAIRAHRLPQPGPHSPGSRPPAAAR